VGDTGGRVPPRRLAIALAAVPLVAAGLADATIIVHRNTHTPPAAVSPHKVSPAPRARPVVPADVARNTAIRQLLAMRSDAVLHHNRAEWASVLDPKSRAFRRRQLATFDNLRQVPLASWSYSLDTTATQATTNRLLRYHAPVFAPMHFTLRYRLSGFDKRPTSLLQYPTFVRRGSRWFLASLSDFASAGQQSALDLWDFGPVAVYRQPRVLVLGHPDNIEVMHEVASEVAADIPRVTAVWGSHWAQRAVVLVPDTQAELARVVADAGDLTNIAAVATAEVQLGTGRPDPVGDRVGINPRNWPKLSPLGRQIVLTHELTHVATRAVTSGSTPTWLAEGFADYVGYLGSGVPTPFVAQDLGSAVRAGRVPSTLPRNGEFDGASKQLSQAYEGAWLACRLIVQRFGQPALVRFYRVVGRAGERPSVAVADALQRMFKLTPREFLAEWHGFLRAQLG